MTDPADRRKYVELAERSVVLGGHLILATFAWHGPPNCCGLEVCRYDAGTLVAELGEAFSLEKEAEETHITPWGSSRAIVYGVLSPWAHHSV